MRLLERRDDTLGIGVCSGACMNYLATHGQSGRLYGCELSLSGTAVYITAGELSIRGYRLYVSDTEELVDLASYGTSSGTTYYMYVRIRYSADEDTATWTLVSSATAPDDMTQTAIETRESGDCYFCLFSFTRSGSTVSSFTSMVDDIEVGSSGLVCTFEDID